jgi:sensor domain CHASE-containing protein
VQLSLYSAVTWIKPARESLKRLTGQTAYWENKSQSQQYHVVITKEYAEQLENTIHLFKKKTGSKKELLLTFVTLNGVKLNMYSRELVAAEVILKDLFD